MISDTVLLINLNSEEESFLRNLIANMEIEELEETALKSVAVSSVEEAKHFLDDETTRLVIMRLEEKGRRIDHEIRRFKKSFQRPVPLMILVPEIHMRKVKDYLRAGADEFWILPLDSSAFVVRLRVLLELGQSIRETHGSMSERQSAGSLWSHVGSRLRRLFAAPDTPAQTAISETWSQLIAGKWQRIRRLGFGSFGEVCLVKDQTGGGLAVAKIPHDKKMNRKFLREAVILKTLNGHPNAVHLKEVVKEEDKLVLIQEYIEGSTLHDLLAEGLSSASKEKAFLQLLDVVAYAHKHNIMHRDIKPENIIVTPNGELKLLDFGTSKDLSRGSISSTVIGSRPYMAPEQIMGKSRIASDVWALGVVLYSLATEFLPFYDENEKQLMDFILETEPDPPRELEPSLSQELEAIILKCLKKDWAERYADAHELRQDLLQKFPDFGTGVALPQQ